MSNPIPTKYCFGDGLQQTAHFVPKDRFSTDQSRPDGLSAYCKACAASRQRQWKHANPDKVRASKRAYLKNQANASR